MTYSADEKAIIWLCACTDLEYRDRAARLRAVSRPSALLNETRTAQADALLSELERKGRFAITLLSDDYPEQLKGLPNPPFALFGAGNRALLKERMFCIVGSRITPPWAEKLAKLTAERLASHYTIVTGLAEGGDRAAIEGAIPSGKLICVLPCGLDECYPAAHLSLKHRIEKGGLVLSEYPPKDKCRSFYFYARNRILAGLSEGVLVVSAGKRSGALMTANLALENGKDVFAFPYNPGTKQGEGCNDLIKKGAYLASGAEDIFECAGIAEQTAVAEALTPEEEKVLDVLRESGELHAAVIAERSGLQIFEAAATLASLEMKNLVVKAGGNRYTAIS